MPPEAQQARATRRAAGKVNGYLSGAMHRMPHTRGLLHKQAQAAAAATPVQPSMQVQFGSTQSSMSTNQQRQFRSTCLQRKTAAHLVHPVQHNSAARHAADEGCNVGLRQGRVQGLQEGKG